MLMLIKVADIRIFEYILIFSATNIRLYHIRIKISYLSQYDAIKVAELHNRLMTNVDENKILNILEV